DGTAGSRKSPASLPPVEILSKDSRILLGSRREFPRVDALRNVGMVGRRGDRQYFADRLDPGRPTMIVDESEHGFPPASSSAWAKYAEALRRISFACRSSRFSRSSAFSFSATSAGIPTRLPPSTSVFFTHSFSVCAVQPIFAATDT